MRRGDGAETTGRSHPNGEPRERERARAAQLVAIFLAGAAAWSAPFLLVVSRDGTWFDIPLPFVYLFITWLAVIVCVARVVRDAPED
jgi:hypothetical protein